MSTLTPLGPRDDFTDDERPTKPADPKLSEADAYALNKVVRAWIASSLEDRRLILALALRLRAGV